MKIRYWLLLSLLPTIGIAQTIRWQRIYTRYNYVSEPIWTKDNLLILGVEGNQLLTLDQRGNLLRQRSYHPSSQFMNPLRIDRYMLYFQMLNTLKIKYF
jgi:hypothetical protein